MGEEEDEQLEQTRTFPFRPRGEVATYIAGFITGGR
jgi:hypothetical protein